MRYTCGRKYTRYMYNDDPQVRTPTTARPLRGVGIPSRTLSRIVLHAVRDGSRSRRVDHKSPSLTKVVLWFHFSINYLCQRWRYVRS